MAIARALAMQPTALLCDEITSALDPELKNEVLAVLEDLKGEGMTLILVTHEIGFARRAADRVVVLADGKIIEDGPPAQVIDNPQGPTHAAVPQPGAGVAGQVATCQEFTRQVENLRRSAEREVKGKRAPACTTASGRRRGCWSRGRWRCRKSLPEVTLRSISAHPHLFRRMMEHADPSAQPGDLVQVRRSRRSAVWLCGCTTRARRLCCGCSAMETSRRMKPFWQERLERAVELRRGMLKLDEVTDAYRVMHSEADGLPGLVVDRFHDTLSAEIYSLGMYQRARPLLRAAGRAVRHEALDAVGRCLRPRPGGVSGGAGVLGRLPAADDDQRVRHEVPRQLSRRAQDGLLLRSARQSPAIGRVLRADAPCWTCAATPAASPCRPSGWARPPKSPASIWTKRPSQLARENAQLNRVKIHFVHADAFAYMRDMLQGGRSYDVVVLDPPKLIRSRREFEEGTRKHFDLNRLAMQLVRPGGLLLSCSCSGLLSGFRVRSFAVVRCAASRSARRCRANKQKCRRRTPRQILAKSGAAADHPVAANCPETEYLHAVWMRLE